MTSEINLLVVTKEQAKGQVSNNTGMTQIVAKLFTIYVLICLYSLSYTAKMADSILLTYKNDLNQTTIDKSGTLVNYDKFKWWEITQDLLNEKSRLCNVTVQERYEIPSITIDVGYSENASPQRRANGFMYLTKQGRRRYKCLKCMGYDVSN